MNLIYLLFAALFYVLSYSPFDYKILIFVSFLILLISIEKLSSKKKALYLFYYSFMIHFIGVSWVSQSLHDYGSLNYYESAFITLIFIILISLPYVIIGFFHKPISANGLYSTNLFASLFVVVEFIKSWMLGGFPWLLVGHSQTETIFNFIYPILGSYAVTYFVILISAWISKGYFNRTKYTVILVPIFTLIYYLMPNLTFVKSSDLNESLSFTIYQPNIYPKESYNSVEANNIQQKYIKFLNRKASTDLIIFPETIVPYELHKNNSLLKKIKDLTDEENIIITGLFTSEDNKFFNSMVFFSKNIEIYNKRKLVPFGEYTPWYDTFFELAESLDIPLSNLSHGRINQKNIYFKDIKIIPVICFESTFSNLINSDTDKELIINISNDSWFGNTLAPYQHLQISQVRALEFNRFMLRATNTGISAFINNKGEVLDYIPNNTEGVITGNIPVNNNISMYSRYGDIGILMLLFFSSLATGLIRLKKSHE